MSSERESAGIASSGNGPGVSTRARECQHCGSWVSAEFVRVLGIDGEVYGCPSCCDRAALANGAAAGQTERRTSEQGAWR